MYKNMPQTYSAHPALALEQLQNAELGKIHDPCNEFNIKYQPPNFSTSASEDILSEHSRKRTHLNENVSEIDNSIEDYVVYDEDEISENMTKECVNCAIVSEDEPDALQKRVHCRKPVTGIGLQAPYNVLNPHRLNHLDLQLSNNKKNYSGCLSGVSSVISSCSASTVSTPLSTPTRLTPHHQVHDQTRCCCPEPIAQTSDILSSGEKSTMPTLLMDTDVKEYNNMVKHNLKQVKMKYELHHLHHHSLSSVKNGCKKLEKFDPRLGPSPYRQLLPIALCILSFAVVFSLLIIYMDTTEIRHQQFRLNMSRDYEMYGVAQDDPQLIEFLREIHMRKQPIHFFKNHDSFSDSALLTPKVIVTENLKAVSNNSKNIFITPLTQQSSNKRLNFSAQHDKYDLAPSMARYVATLVGNKPYVGSFIQSLPGSLGHLLTAPWLAETLNWVGVIVEPEARRYFSLHKQNAQRAGLQVVQACVSPTSYPKEVTLHSEDSEVRINSLLEEETSWFNPRVKCFPLYTIMLACNRTQYDLLSLGVHGHELEILQTLPFEKLQIAVISIHLPDDHEDAHTGSSQLYIQAITQFLMNKSYKMQRQFGRNFFYHWQKNFINRTRKKDISLLKSP